MDRTRFKRPEIQIQRQTTKTTFGSPQPVPKVDLLRPETPPVMPRPGGLAVQRTLAQPPEVLARQVPIDMELPGEESAPHPTKRFKWNKASRLATRSLAVGLVLVITLGGLLVSQSYLKVNEVFKGGAGTAAALEDKVDPDRLKGEGRGRVNVLLLGRGGGTHTAPDLTDTMMVASIDPVNKSTTLLSVPRDLWVNVPGKGVMKINAAWEAGVFGHLGRTASGSTDPKAIAAGYKTLDATLKEVLGLEIDYHVLVDFQAFKQAVDTVGGVDVNVPADLVDPTMAWENRNDPLLAKAGLQSFDGTKALNYVRSRQTSNDFARSERQRATLLALKSKVVNAGTFSNPSKMSGLLSALGNNVQTDLTLGNASRLYKIMKGVGDTSVNSISLASETAPLVTTSNVNGQSVVLPKAGLYKYSEIQQYIRAQLKDPYILKEKAKVLILNGTAMPGLATAKSDELKTYGYNVVGAANAPTSGWTSTVLVDLTHKNKYTKNYLEQRLGQKAANSLSDTTIATNGADFVIIIGSNETNPTQHQAY